MNGRWQIHTKCQGNLRWGEQQLFQVSEPPGCHTTWYVRSQLQKRAVFELNLLNCNMLYINLLFQACNWGALSWLHHPCLRR